MMTQPLRRQFRLWTVVLVVVPSLLIMAMYTLWQIEVAKQKNLELISQRVTFQKRLIESWIEARSNDVRTLSQMEVFRILDKGQMKNTLDLMQRYSKDFDSLSYIDKDGFFRISTLSTGIRIASTSGQPYFQTAVAGQEYISDVVIGRNSGLPIINFSSPIYDKTGKFQGLILGSVRTTTIETLLRDNWVGQSGEILLVNGQGTMIAEPRYIHVLVERGLAEGTSKMKVKLSNDALNTIHLGEIGTATWIDYLGNNVMGAYQYLPERGWTLIGSISKAEILAPIYSQLAIMAGGTLMLVLLILPLATLVTNRVKRPIDWLIEQSDLVASENYAMIDRTQRLEEMPLELGTLCETFIQMSCKIQNTVRLLKENEAKLESKVLELEAANKELEAFSYSVSHDLRAPLRGIDGFSQALLEDYGDKVGEKGVDYLRRVRSGAQKMGALIDDLLKLSRVSRSEMRLEVVDISAMVQSIMDDYHKVIPERSVEFVIQSNLSVLADRSLLRIMLTNLVDNAWKYSSKAVKARIEFGLLFANGENIFFLRDNGVGFDMAYADKLFSPFQRLHTIVEFPGTGIGLATVLRIMRRHGGKIWAEASLNEGATFYFSFER